MGNLRTLKARLDREGEEATKERERLQQEMSRGTEGLAERLRRENEEIR